MVKSIGNIVLLVGIACFAIYYFIDVQTLPLQEERTVVEFLFYVLMILLAFEASNIIIKTVKAKRAKKPDVIIEQNKDVDMDPSELFFSFKAFLLMIFLVSYVILIPLLGFFTASFVFILALNYYLKNRTVMTLVVIPLIVLSGSYYLFVELLSIGIIKGVFI